MLCHVTVEDLRNLKAQRIVLDPNLTVVTGANAQGKSSVLEAAYLLATTRSFRTKDAREAIHLKREFLTVAGQLEVPSQPPLRFGLRLGKGRGNRRLTVGEYDTLLKEYLGLLPALYMAGGTVQTASGSPSERRRFMDRATAAADEQHIQNLADYRRALAQRNQLLKAQANDAQLDPWDELLAQSGEKISTSRIGQLERWRREITSWPDLFPECSNVRLTYRVAGEPEDDLAERLKAARGKDRRMGVTTVGPHRDDLVLKMGEKNLWKFGSAGQVRSALSALTLAQARAVAARRTPRPLLVLDDVDTDLDPDRLAAFLNAAAKEGQVIAATCKPQTKDLPIDGRLLTAEDGQIAGA